MVDLDFHPGAGAQRGAAIEIVTVQNQFVESKKATVSAATLTSFLVQLLDFIDIVCSRIVPNEIEFYATGPVLS